MVMVVVGLSQNNRTAPSVSRPEEAPMSSVLALALLAACACFLFSALITRRLRGPLWLALHHAWNMLAPPGPLADRVVFCNRFAVSGWKLAGHTTQRYHFPLDLSVLSRFGYGWAAAAMCNGGGVRISR